MRYFILHCKLPAILTNSNIETTAFNFMMFLTLYQKYMLYALSSFVTIFFIAGSKVVYTDVDAERDVMDDSVDETNGENTNNNNTEEGVSNEDDKDDIKKDLSEKEISLKVTDADDDVV